MANVSILSGPKAAHSDFVGDIQQLQTLKQGPNSQTKEGLERVAREFESLYLKMMLDSMRAAEKIWSKDNPLASSEQDMFRDMLDGQLSKDLSTTGSLGLADMLVKQLSPFVQQGNEGQMTKTDTNKNTEAAKPLALPQYRALTPTYAPINQSNSTASSMRPTQFNSQVSIPPHINIEQLPTTIDIDAIAGKPAEFIAALLPYAVEPAAKLGVDPRLLVAQAALETGWGRSLQRDQHGFNLFGIKAGSSWQGARAVHPTHEIYNNALVRQPAAFRQYQSPQASFDDYVAVIQNHYGQALQQSGDPRGYMNALKAGGYATDPDYAGKVLAVYESPRLQNSSITSFSSSNPVPTPVATLVSYKDPRLKIW